MAIILKKDMVNGSAVNVAALVADTSLGKTYALPENTYSFIEVQVVVEVTTAGGSTAQNDTIKIKAGSTVIESLVTAVAAAVSNRIYTLIGIAEVRGAKVIDVAVSGPAADAVSTFTIHSFKVIGHN